MKSKKFIAALCALAVVVSSAGGLPFGGLRLFDTAVTASAADFEGDGSATSPYLIASAADWNALANAVNSGESYSGKYFKLTEDISVSTMIGKNNHGGGSHIPFSGTFDGDGHVLTVNINSTSTHGAAPFCGVQNAVIKNLKVEGSVVGGIHSSGLVGTTSSNDSGTLTIENVVVNVDVSGNTHLGGVVGHGFGTNITLKNVSYGGKIAGTSFSGGLVGWCGPNAKLTAENCSFSGTYSGGFHPIGFAYSSGNAQVTSFYTTKTATNTTQNQYTYTGGLTQNTVSITAPTAKTDLSSDGTPVELIEKGTTDKGTMKYSLDGMTYSEEIPKAAAGEHSVWYRVEVNDNYISEKRIEVNVAHAHAFTYTITIPESVNIDGGKAEFKAENVTLPDGAKINITVDGENTESGQTMFNAKNEAGNSTVSYTIKNGSADVADGGIALTFTEGGTQTLSFAKKADSTPTYAGKHTETLTFGISVEDAVTAPTLAGVTLTDGMIIEPHCTVGGGDNWVQFKYVADDNKFVPNFNTYNDVYSKSGGPIMQELADQWAFSTLYMHENPNGKFYLTQTGNTVHLRADDGINMNVIDLQLDFDNMTYTQSYKQWYSTVSGSFTSIKIGDTTITASQMTAN